MPGNFQKIPKNTKDKKNVENYYPKYNQRST